ncbi:hypothetical protein F5Y19DRAFT_450797 [Xylariaceae sp. FL1651]|nr:hypothetical protein F5Y19DRAFT_450797 [Xylariaceae sp. FL1651]
MWGPYPALVAAAADGGGNGTVEGVAWYCDKPEYVARLYRYKTDVYRMAYCKIHVPSLSSASASSPRGGDMEILKNGGMFVSTCDLEELDEGKFVIGECCTSRMGRF